jgi:ketosteroid isomerase-like protein
MSRESRLRDTYAAFNARDIDRVLEQMTADVDWPNAWEGGRVLGRAAVRDYWRRQWAAIDPHVEPKRVTALPDGRVEIEVHQVARALDGTILSDGIVKHVYGFRGGLIARMDVSESGSE